MIGIVIVTYESERDIGFCLRSIAAHTQLPFQLVIIDNNSTDATCVKIAEILTQGILAPDRTMCRDFRFEILETNIGYAPAINKGAKWLPHVEHLVFLNPDTIVTSGWLKRLKAHLTSDVAVVGPLSNASAGYQKVLYWLQEIDQQEHPHLQYGVGAKISVFGEGIAQHFAGQNKRVKFISGFCMMTSRSKFEELGMFDECFFLGIDDLEFSLRVQSAGYSLAVACDVFVYHRGNSSISSLPRKKYQQLHMQMGQYFCSLLRKKYGDKIPSSEELFGFSPFFEPAEFEKGEMSTSLQWHNSLITLDGEHLESIQEFA